jgi:hypothetical protein
MAHPYVEYEATALWKSIDATVKDLEENGDVELTTARPYVLGYLCRELTRAGVAVPANGDSVPVVLASDEALVLFELLARRGDAGPLVIEDPAEERVLWGLEAALERRLVEPFRPDYAAQLAAARERISGGS